MTTKINESENVHSFSCGSKIFRKRRGRAEVHTSPPWWGPGDPPRAPWLQGQRRVGDHGEGAPGPSRLFVIQNLYHEICTAPIALISSEIGSLSHIH